MRSDSASGISYTCFTLFECGWAKCHNFTEKSLIWRYLKLINLHFLRGFHGEHKIQEL